MTMPMPDQINREALLELVTAAMCAGAMMFAEKAGKREVAPGAPLADVFGDYPEEFIKIRSRLIVHLVAASSGGSGDTE